MFYVMLIIVCALPIGMLTIGLAWKKTLPKRKSSKQGLRTKMSMRNNETWKFAQESHSQVLVILGSILILINLGVIFTFREKYLKTSIFLILLNIASLTLSVIPTEKKLEKNFDKDGRRIRN